MSKYLTRLQELREKHNYSLKTMAEELKLSPYLYTKYEKNPLCMPAEILIRLSEFFNTSPDYLLERTDVQLSIEDIEELISANASEDLVEKFYIEKRNHRENNRKIQDDLAFWKKIIQSRLEETNMTIKELVKKTELSYDTVNEYIYKPQSNTQVKMETLIKIFKALNMRIDTVLRVNTTTNDNSLRELSKKANKLSPKLKILYISILDFLFHVDITTIKENFTDKKNIIDNSNQGFKNRLRFLRKFIGNNNQPGTTQYGLSLLINTYSEGKISCSEKTVRNFESSEAPNMRYVEAISKVWDIPIDYLVGLSDDSVDLSRFENFCLKFSKLTPIKQKIIEN